MPPVIDVTAASYATAAIVVYYVFLFLVGRARRQAPPAPGSWPLVVFVVPARNEAQVLQRTVDVALACEYPGALRVLVMDDASTDGTAEVAQRLVELDGRVRVCHRSASQGGRGKSDVLNHGYFSVRELVRDGDPWVAGADEASTCLCVLDADGHLSPTAVTDAATLLWASGVGSVQIGVRIRNARDNLLTRLQDMEFVGFSFMVQTARDRLGSVGLGGNGQFTRLAALSSLGDAPWRSQALTEDLDLGVRLQLAGWRLRFCATCWVAQEGLTQIRPLLRQRTRWTQGHYQCWRYLPRISSTRGLTMTQRLDTLAYLTLILLVVLVSVTTLVQILNLAHVIEARDSFLSWMGNGLGYRLTEFMLSWSPVFLLVATYQRFAERKLALWEIPAYCVFFAAYVYLWSIATVRAGARLGLRRGGWHKTPRIGPLPFTGRPSTDVAPG